MEEQQLAFESRRLKTAGQSASVALASISKPRCWRLRRNLEEKSHFGSKPVKRVPLVVDRPSR